MRPLETQVHFYGRILKVLVFLLSCSSLLGLAQDPPVTPVIAPPPAKMIPREARAQIDAQRDIKVRLRLTIELSETYLAKAESLTDQQDFNGATAELGKYAALIEEALNFLKTMSRDRTKTRDLYKRLELALRAHGPRITAMRRATPMEYAVWIKGLEESTRQGRTEALNSFYGHTVLREPKPETSRESKPNPERKPQQ